MKGNDLNMYETKVKIDGMMCGMCESHINDAIRNAFSVTGYDFVSMTSKPYEKHGLFGFLKK